MRHLVVVLAACGGASPRAAQPGASIAPLSLAADTRMIAIPGGKFIAGSTPEERASAYDDHETTSGASTARDQKWFDREEDRHSTKLGAFRIDLLPVTQAEYAELVATGQVPAPAIDEAAWQAQGLAQDYATQVARFVWHDGRPPAGREDHPVVLVTWSEAERYCAWRGQQRGEARRLPTASEYEKATRGNEGLAYPWGNTFDPAALNSAVAGPKDTVPVNDHGGGASPFGVLGLAGNVRHWTSTKLAGGEVLVKGSAWDEHGGLGRGAAGRGQRPETRAVGIGFRCAADPAPE